jgi:poly(hydroxyalkanoate) depolymerase family esterase
LVIRGLHDTITRLAALRAFEARGSIESNARLSAFEDFGSNPGALNARTYIPSMFRRGSPLVVVLHGCTQNASAYDRGAGWSKAADEEGFALLFPEQQRANNPNLCFNWFSSSDSSRGSGEALSIRQMVAEMHARHGTDSNRVFVTGLSAGGAMAAVMLATYPEVFAGGGIIAGLPFASAQSVPEAFDRMRGHGGPDTSKLSEMVRSASGHVGRWPTISIWHGSSDRTVDPSNAQDLVDQWRTLHGAPETPCRTDEIEGNPHRVWCDTNGREVIEEFLITGMAHGAPLSTLRSEFGEVAGPYMLEAGISSTRYICRFWGLSDGVGRRSGAPHAVEHYDLETSQGSNLTYLPGPRQPRSPVSAVRKTIDDALRAAGLLS